MKRGFFYYFGMVMMVVYIIAGAWVLLYGASLQYLADKPAYLRYVLGAMLIAYGLYRFGKQQYQQRHDNQYHDYNEQILDNDDERA